ncbi:MAG: Hpt domain-containing protein [Nitrospira sp.]|nr:Hpt domain-containing protein [Nitrospira sp.]
MIWGGDDDPDFFPNLVAQFLEEAPRRLADIRTALRRAQAVELRRAAHGLKGSCNNMGATRLARVCLQLQRCGDAGDLTGAEPLVALLDAEFETVGALLTAETMSHEKEG